MAADQTLPARQPREHKQVALQSALTVLAPLDFAAGVPHLVDGASRSTLDRPDTPDEVVTAVRRLPAIQAAYAPFPEAVDPRLKAAFAKRAQQRQQGHAEDGVVIALDRLEQLHSWPLHPKDADAIANLRPFGVKIGVDEGFAERPDSSLRRAARRSTG